MYSNDLGVYVLYTVEDSYDT